MRRLEELSANAWPGLRAVLVDGWIIRFAEGYSSRANSVLPLYPGRSSMAEKISHCEDLAQSRGIRPTFKLFPDAVPADLDAELERRGYDRVAETAVMVLEKLQAPEALRSGGYRIRVAQRLEDCWFAFYASAVGLNDVQAGAARAIMEHILPRRCFVLLEGEDGPVACALAVTEDGWAGIFDVTVRKELRGRGLGRRIMEITLAEARAEGASRSYLQVVNGNRAAEELYRRLGYTVAYSYWYRVKPEKP